MNIYTTYGYMDVIHKMYIMYYNIEQIMYIYLFFLNRFNTVNYINT